jgi:hypothetical protein
MSGWERRERISIALQGLLVLAIVTAIVAAVGAAVSSAPRQSVDQTPASGPCQDRGSGGPGNPLTGSDVEHDPAGCDPAEGVDINDVYADNAPSEGDSFRDSYDPGP